MEPRPSRARPDARSSIASGRHVRTSRVSVRTRRARLRAGHDGVRVTHEDFRQVDRVGSGWNFVGCGDEGGRRQRRHAHRRHGRRRDERRRQVRHAPPRADPGRRIEGKMHQRALGVGLGRRSRRRGGRGKSGLHERRRAAVRADIDAAVREMVAMGVIVVAAARSAGRNSSPSRCDVSSGRTAPAVTVGSTSCPSSGDGGGRCASDAVSDSSSNYGRVVDVGRAG